MAFNTPEQYNTHLAESLTKIELNEYFKAYHQQFCPTQDITFMEYFLELCHHKHEFCVPHIKLFEYGIMVKCASTDVLRRLKSLELKNDEDFELRKVSELRNQGGTSNKTIYMLKPSAFELMSKYTQDTIRRRSRVLFFE